MLHTCTNIFLFDCKVKRFHAKRTWKIAMRCVEFKGPGSIWSIFGLNISENLALFIVFRVLLTIRKYTNNVHAIMFKILIMHPVLPWKHQQTRRNCDFLYFNVISGTSDGYLNTALLNDQHKKFHKSGVRVSLRKIEVWCWSSHGAVFIS